MSFEKSYQVFGNINAIEQKKTIALTIGNFDGVHSGHCYLLSELKKNAKFMC